MVVEQISPNRIVPPHKQIDPLQPRTLLQTHYQVHLVHHQVPLGREVCQQETVRAKVEPLLFENIGEAEGEENIRGGREGDS